MKTKYLLCLLFTIIGVSMSETAFAQLDIIQDRSDEHILFTAKKYGNYFLTLMEAYDIYYIVCAQTTNQFDTKFNGVTLGTTKSACLTTINDLLSIADTQKQVVVNDRIFGEVKIWGTKAFGAKILGVKNEDNVGMSYYYLKDLALISEYISNNLSDD